MSASTCRTRYAASNHLLSWAIAHLLPAGALRKALRHHPPVLSFIPPLLFILGGCTRPSVEPVTPLRSDLAAMHREITTDSPEAQKYFDQGLVLYYGFNHDAAIASFKQAAAYDPGCAMAYWGQAISAGPNINNTFMDSAAARLAWENVRKARELSPHTTAFEQALISALTARYAWPRPEDRRSLDVAYADSMRTVWRRFPHDADAGALFADAMLILRPWDLWLPNGEPQPGTPEIVATLEQVLSFAPAHIGACHFYIHTMEASHRPGKALAAADSLRGRVPGAGHLLHMPSHIDVRLGRYEEVIEANLRGITSDSTWLSQAGFYAFYRAHNFHFLAYGAMFEGRKQLAMKAARDMVNTIPVEVVREYADFLDGFIAVPTHVMVRFGLWEELLAEPAPPADLVGTTAFWRYGRTVALSALGRVKEAGVELKVFKAACAAVPESRLIGNNTVRKVLDVGLPMAEGEYEYRRGNYTKAFRLLSLAVQRDDSLRYDEPWGWMMPIRHSLGALLLEQGKIPEAERVYRDDLAIHPNNGWALKGLAECLHRTGRHEEAEQTDEKFQAAWARSDIALKASCFCRTSHEI
jgi:tetratricopeptide (TPR) repeat protein